MVKFFREKLNSNHLWNQSCSQIWWRKRKGRDLSDLSKRFWSWAFRRVLVHLESSGLNKCISRTHLSERPYWAELLQIRSSRKATKHEALKLDIGFGFLIFLREYINNRKRRGQSLTCGMMPWAANILLEASSFMRSWCCNSSNLPIPYLIISLVAVMLF